MGRAKARMVMISNKKARRVVFEKRRKSLEKKASDLSKLCDVKICMIIFDPLDDCKPNEPRIWPEDQHEQIESLIDSFKKVNLGDRKSRTTDFSSFYRSRKKNAEEELARLKRTNLEAKLPTWDEKYDSLPSDELIQVDVFLKAKIERMKVRANFLKGNQTYNFTATGGIHNYLYRMQPQPMASSDQIQNGNPTSDLSAFSDHSYNCNNSMQNQGMMSLNLNYNNIAPPQFNMEPTAAAEHVVISLGNQLYYCVPGMQPIPICVQYLPQQQLRAPAAAQMYAAPQTDHDNNGFGLIGDFQHMNLK